MMQRALESMAAGPQERARDRRATARRLIGELAPHRARLTAALGLVLLGAATQAAGPFVIGQAIDRAIVPGRRGALAAWMAALAVIYVVGALASRAQTRPCLHRRCPPCHASPRRTPADAFARMCRPRANRTWKR